MIKLKDTFGKVGIRIDSEKQLRFLYDYCYSHGYKFSYKASLLMDNFKEGYAIWVSCKGYDTFYPYLQSEFEESMYGLIDFDELDIGYKKPSNCKFMKKRQ